MESVPREFFALYEKGGLQLGALRGFSLAVALGIIDSHNSVQGLAVSAPLLTAI